MEDVPRNILPCERRFARWSIRLRRLYTRRALSVRPFARFPLVPCDRWPRHHRRWWTERTHDRRQTGNRFGQRRTIRTPNEPRGYLLNEPRAFAHWTEEKSVGMH